MSENKTKNEIEDKIQENISHENSNTILDENLLDSEATISIETDSLTSDNNDTKENDLVDFEKVDNEYVFSNPDDNNVNNSDNIENGVSNISSDEELKEKKFEIKNQVSEKSHKKTIIGISIALIIIILLFILLSTIFAIVTSYKKTIINGVSIKDINVSGLTKEQALDEITKSFNEKLSKDLTLKHNEYEINIFPEQFNVSFDLEKAVDMAYSKGRSGNIFQNNYEIIISRISGIKITPGFTYNEDSFKSLVAEIETNLSDRLVEPSYYIDGNNLILTKGKDGVVVDSEKLKNDIIYAVNNIDNSENTIEIPTIYKTASTLDINKIHSEVYRAPQDAYYTTNPYAVYPHVDGIDFKISVEEAINGYNVSQDSFQIPLKVLSPNVTTNQIGTEAFPNLLASFSTSFSTRNTNRSTNIRLATSKINGTVVMPGETFSYNQTVGRRTAAAGFKEAGVYSGGEVTTGIGGGICQVSSTLYNSVLLSNLEIVERYNHGFNPGYVPAGRDATVSWGGPDFKFKNSRAYPIKIDATVSGGTILIKIWGLKGDNEYDVEIQSYITSYIQYKTTEKKDPALAKGATKVIQSGSNGCRSVCYRILKQNGNVISKTLISNDTYSPHNKIVAVGTKE